MAKHLAVASELGLDTVGLPISSDPIESLFGVVNTTQPRADQRRRSPRGLSACLLWPTEPRRCRSRA